MNSILYRLILSIQRIMISKYCFEEFGVITEKNFHILQLSNSDKKTITPMMSVIVPTKSAFFRIFFSSSVSSDHGFCCMPIAISIAIPSAVPMGMPMTKPITKSLILSALY